MTHILDRVDKETVLSLRSPFNKAREEGTLSAALDDQHLQFAGYVAGAMHTVSEQHEA